MSDVPDSGPPPGSLAAWAAGYITDQVAENHRLHDEVDRLTAERDDWAREAKQLHDGQSQ